MTRYLIFLLLLASSCTDATSLHPVIGRYTLTHVSDTWIWEFTASGNVIETIPGQVIGGGLWWQSDTSFHTVTVRHGETWGRLKQDGTGWMYETNIGTIKMQKP